MSTTTQRQPAFSTRHRQLESALWENQGPNQRSFYNCSLTKSWKPDDSEEWKKSSMSLGSNDILPAVRLLDWADNAIGKAISANAQSEVGKKPIASKKRGLIEVGVWHKTTEDGDRYYVSLKRSYNDGNEWKDVLVWLGSDDVLPAGRLLTRSFDAIDQLYADGSSNFVAKATGEIDANSVDDDDIPF